ncbi:conserved hypothetical protein [Tenacibaculum sp. 190524A05c]
MLYIKQSFFKNIRLLIFLVGCVVLSSCNKTTDTYEQTIKHAILSHEFQDYYKICKRRTRIFYIYHNLSLKNDLSFIIKNRCNQSINFLKLNFKFDINTSLERQHKGVVLYKYKSLNNMTELGFVDLESNANLILRYDGNHKLIERKTGVF